MSALPHCRPNLTNDQRGLTGIETAILLIAFVVVASVFAYTVLSSGLFATEASKRTFSQGLSRAGSSLAPIGAIRATGVTKTALHSADDNWTTPDSDVSNSVDTSDRKEGTGSVTITINSGFTTGLVGRENLGDNVDISAHYTLSLWAKTDTDVAAGDLAIILDDDSNCASPIDTVALPALTAADGWVLVQTRVTDRSLLTAVRCAGLWANADPGAIVLQIDDLMATPELQRIHVPVALTGGDNATDLTQTTDTDADGLLSDETAQAHSVAVHFTDRHQLLRDVAWTVQWMGKGDDDVLLERGEKAMLTVDVSAADPIPTELTLFSLNVAPGSGAPITIEVTAPKTIEQVMLLD